MMLKYFKIESSNLAVKASTTEPESTPLRPRRSHKKSRTGCRNCKVRRVKCDENRDGTGCMKCKSHGISCDYLLTQPRMAKVGHPNESRTQLRQNDNLVQTASGGGLTPVARADLILAEAGSAHSDGESLVAFGSAASAHTFMSLGSPRLPFECPESLPMVSPLVALQHFVAFTSYTCGSEMGQTIIRTRIISRAMQTPYLVHAMLGVAAAHLGYLLPPSVNATQHGRARLGEAWHWSNALGGYREELSREGGKKEQMDSLLSFAMLIAIHQFARGVERDEPCFVSINEAQAREKALKWLSIQCGFGLILRELEDFLSESVWLPVFQDAQVGNVLKPRSCPGWDEVEKAFFDICDVDSNSATCSNPYLDSLQALIGLRRMRPVTVGLFNKLVTFMGRVSAEFTKLLLDRDTAALLLLAHWLALMLKIEQWWIVDRAKTEVEGIVMFLHKRELQDVKDERLRILLREPAEAVGIIID